VAGFTAQNCGMETETLIPTTTSSTTTITDPRPLFVAAVDIATPIIAGVRADQFELPSPCHNFTVKGLLDHLVFVLHRVATIGRGEDAFSPGSLGDPAAEHLVSGAWDYEADWLAAADSVDDVWSDDALLDTTVVLPWATMTGAEMLAMYVSEITTHTWDIATATGQQARWDDAVCQLSLDTMHRDLPMADRTPMWDAFRATVPTNLQFDAPFANAVAVSSDAPLIDQLVAWTGRQP
jgi:uncharacterized protein (TIGR03086 family)